jgi:hypothetical protein
VEDVVLFHRNSPERIDCFNTSTQQLITSISPQNAIISFAWSGGDPCEIVYLEQFDTNYQLVLEDQSTIPVVTSRVVYGHAVLNPISRVYFGFSYNTLISDFALLRIVISTGIVSSNAITTGKLPLGLRWTGEEVRLSYWQNNQLQEDTIGGQTNSIDTNNSAVYSLSYVLPIAYFATRDQPIIGISNVSFQTTAVSSITISTESILSTPSTRAVSVGITSTSSISTPISIEITSQPSITRSVTANVDSTTHIVASSVYAHVDSNTPIQSTQHFVIQPTTTIIAGNPLFYNNLVIPQNSHLVFDVSGLEILDGTTLTIFEFSTYEGSFQTFSLEGYTSYTCTRLDHSLEYGERSISVAFNVVNTCQNSQSKLTLLSYVQLVM